MPSNSDNRALHRGIWGMLGTSALKEVHSEADLVTVQHTWKWPGAQVQFACNVRPSLRGLHCVHAPTCENPESLLSRLPQHLPNLHGHEAYIGKHTEAGHAPAKLKHQS